LPCARMADPRTSLRLPPPLPLPPHSTGPPQFANQQLALRFLDAVNVVKGQLSGGADTAALVAAVGRWKAKDDKTKTPLGRGL
jgi:hypothetical protein